MIEDLGHQPLALVPNESHLYYQLYAYSPAPNSVEVDKKFMIAINETYSWLRQRLREVDTIPPNLAIPEELSSKDLHSFRVRNGPILHQVIYQSNP